MRSPNELLRTPQRYTRTRQVDTRNTSVSRERSRNRCNSRQRDFVSCLLAPDIMFTHVVDAIRPIRAPLNCTSRITEFTLKDSDSAVAPASPTLLSGNDTLIRIALCGSAAAATTPNVQLRSKLVMAAFPRRLLEMAVTAKSPHSLPAQGPHVKAAAPVREVLKQPTAQIHVGDQRVPRQRVCNGHNAIHSKKVVCAARQQILHARRVCARRAHAT